MGCGWVHMKSLGTGERIYGLGLGAQDVRGSRGEVLGVLVGGI
jgi:hypothetical protein